MTPLCHRTLLQTNFALPVLAKRTAQLGCWARFRLDANSFLCINREEWLRTFSPQQIWSGKWAARSFPELGFSAPKKIHSVFYATGGSNPNPKVWGQFLSSAIRNLEIHREKLSASLAPLDRNGVFRKLLLGESTHSGELIRRIGFIHILSASGIHLLALSFWIYWVLSWAIQIFNLDSIVATFLKRSMVAGSWIWCWLLAGAPQAMLRPILLLLFQALSKRFGFRWKKSGALLLALGIDFSIGGVWQILHHGSIGDALTDPGRLIYLFAVSGIILMENEKLGPFGLAFSSWILSSLFLFTQSTLVSLGSSILSWLSVPWICGLVYPALVLRSLVSYPLEPLLKWSERALEILLRWSLQVHSLWVISPVSVLMGALLALVLWLIPKRWRIPCGLFFALGSTLPGFARGPDPAGVPGYADQVEQLDVGQGDAALIEEGAGEHQQVGMIDAGSAKRIEAVDWLEFFASKGITHLDWIGVTHLDEDHSGGVFPITSVISVNCVATSAAELATPRGIRWKGMLEEQNVKVTSDLKACVPYPSLAPPARRPHSSRHHQANENMSAFLIPLREGGFYLSAGDATAKEEPRIGLWAEKLAEPFAKGPRILKISHHGSKTSSNPIFLSEIRPTEAWISDGVGNPYGHPSSEVLARLQRFGIPVKRTDQIGTVIWNDGAKTTEGVFHRR